MGLGEKLFLLLGRGLRDRASAGAPEDALALAEVGARLQILAEMLAEGPVCVAPCEDAGVRQGATVLVPARIAGLGSRSLALEAYLYRIAYASASRSLGFRLGDAARGPVETDLATLLAAPATERRMLAELPGVAPLRARLRRAALALRPPPARVRSASDVLELLCRRRLGEEAEGGGGETSKAVGRWLAHAVSAEPEDRRRLERAAAVLAADLRALLPRQGRGIEPVVLWGRLLPESASETAGAAETESGEAERAPGARSAIRLERALRPRRIVRREREDRPLQHMFEKIETAEEYGGEKATPDAGGDVRDLEDALRDLELATVIRTTEAPESLVRAEMILEPASLLLEDAGDAEREGAFRYPEWDWRRKAYRENWCALYEHRETSGDGGAANAEISRRIVEGRRPQVEQIRAQAVRALFRRRTRNRQLDGPDFDLDALVERRADLCAGRTPPERLYLSARRLPREAAILVLLDSSYSTDAYVEGRRVLDVEIESMLTLSAALEGLIEEEIAVASFSSRTRADCRFGVIKRFDDPWRRVYETLPALEAGGYTRIGPAVRHAAAQLQRSRARHKLLLLVSDGKPTDYDRYEGRYGVEDVSKAIREARARGLLAYGLAVEKEAKAYLARMLGTGHYAILPHADRLAGAMADVFVRFMAL